MARLLIDACEVVVTMDDEGTELAGGSILIEDGSIAWVGSGPPPEAPDETIDGRGTVAVPGLINTHHHLYQSLTRVRAREGTLFEWLTELYPVWANLDEAWVHAATSVGLAELALSGCATSTDHHYVFPEGRGDLLGAEIRAAQEIGIRFHPNRGSMDLGQSHGGLPPDVVCQPADRILAQTEEAVGRWHDPSPGSMLRIGIAPCSPFSSSEGLMRDSADLARRLGVRMHTHVEETFDEERFCQERFGMRPVELMDDWGWLGPDVWFAHGVHLSEKDVHRLAETGTGVAHCPTSNLRLGSGIAPVRSLVDETVPVGLGVDGSASNDAGNLLAEVRMAMLVARAAGDPTGLTAREALRLATRGGAACLGRDDLGSLEAGKRADVALFSIDTLAHAGAEADPVAAVVSCQSQRVRHLLVDGQPVVRSGQLVNAEEDAVAREGHRIGAAIAGGRWGG
jgi:cytosine/adenosine deaminase-related metal-dependent hydrolase